VIDLHSHLLPGLDDGAADLGASVRMARAAAREGVTTMAGTPHVRGADFPTSVARMEAALRAVQDAVRADGLQLRVVGGGEVSPDRIGVLSASELRRFTLGANGRYFLLEIPSDVLPFRLDALTDQLARDGLTPVLAHPERCRAVQRDPGALEPAIAAGALVQVTAAALDGRMGARLKRSASALVDGGRAHLIASDAHGPEARAGLSGALAALADTQLGRWMTQEVPAAILAGAGVPPPPVRQRRSRFGSRPRG
jgi:protein-tyrosine phosphatase